MQTQEAVETAYDVERDGFAQCFCHTDLEAEDAFLLVERGSAKGVETAFAQGYYLWVAEQLGKRLEHLTRAGFVVGPPGVYARGVCGSLAGLKLLGMERPLEGEIDRGVGGLEVVGVEIWKQVIINN